MSISKKKIEAKNKLVSKEIKNSSLIINVWFTFDQPKILS
jgi:hypothetical protein